MQKILFLAFALSGGAGLVYEAVWGRYLALFVGHSAYAQVLVMGTYLGGMAVGALLVGERAKRIRNPLLWYASVEGILGLAGILFHPFFLGVTSLAYERLIPAVGNPALAGAGKWGLAVALLLPQAVLLGTTFPLMSSGYLRAFPQRPGRTLSLLYFANSFGAAIGVLVGGFVLVRAVGLPGALLTAGGLNLMAATGAGWVWQRTRSRREAREKGIRVGARREEGGRGHGAPGLVRVLLAVSFLTAVASFAYEIGWIRMLSLVMGSATHSFEIMLSAFILGLALGAVFIRRLADRGEGALTLLGWIQWIMGLAALGTLPVYASTFEFMAFLVDALPETDGGYALFGLARYSIAIAIMLPSTIMAGMTLPLITATLLHTGRGEEAIGWVYGWNTLGSVLGVALAGLVFLPVLGLKGLILAGALLDMGLGVALLGYAGHLGALPRFRPAPFLAVGGMVVAGLGVHLGLEMDRRLLTSGVYRYGAIPSDQDGVLFYKDGRTATVAVHLGEPEDLAVLTTNGKPDASISLRWIRAQGVHLPVQPIEYDDEATQTLLALIPLAHGPDAVSAALIGHGSGVTGHTLLASPEMERMVTVEIEPEMIAASQAFYPANARVFDDPRSTFVIDDAKSFFANRQERFDLIISEPSNPWVSGTSSLFTREFYRRMGGYLAPGGIFAQWFQCYEITDDLVLSVLAALNESFPYFQGYQVAPGDLLILASLDRPLANADWSVFHLSEVARMLAHVPPMEPEYLESLRVFDESLLAPLLEDHTPVNSDFFPHLDLGAEEARFRRERAHGFLGLGSRRIDLAATLRGVPNGFARGWAEPILNLGPVSALSVGAWLREVRMGDDPDPRPPGLRHQEALELYRAFSLTLNRRQPPQDWSAFSRLAAQAEAAVHGGTSGVADSLFYRRLFHFLREQDAPLGARASGEFLYGVASWEHARTLQAGEILLDARGRGEEWLPDALLRDGMVLALLTEGEVGRAGEVLDLFKPAPGEKEEELVVEILRGLVDAAGPGGR